MKILPKNLIEVFDEVFNEVFHEVFHEILAEKPHTSC